MTTLTRSDAIVSLAMDHTYGRHRERRHPQCPVCLHADDRPEWVRKAQAGTLPVRVEQGAAR